MRKAVAALGGAAVLLAAPLVCGVAWAAPHDDLTIGVTQFPSSLHPDIDPEVVKSYVLGFATRPVTAYDAAWQHICMLCAQMPSLENGLARIEDRPGGGRGIAVTLKLRDDWVWGDGVPVTTADLVFTAKVGRDPGTGVADTRVWGRIPQIDVIDAHTAVLHYDEVSVVFDRIGGLLPAHLDAPVFDAHHAPGEYARQTLYNRAPLTPGLYNGPYVITEYRSGERIVLEPSKTWTGDKPSFRRIIIKAIENTAALQANLMSGDVDMAPGDAPSLTIDQVLALRKQQPDRFAYVFHPALTYENVTLNLDNPILADVRVRRAMLAALDRKVIVDKLFEGLQPVATSFVNPLDPMYASDLTPAPYDPGHARALLADAGWTPGADGICRNAKGERLSLEFGTTAGNRLRELQQQVLKDQWRAVGIEVIVKNEPARTFFGDTLKHRAFTLAMFAWTSSISYPSRQTLGGDQVPTAANGWAGSNYMDWHNSRMDDALHVAETALDPTQQKEAWSIMQHAYADDVPVLPLFYRAEAYVLPKWLAGLRPTGHTDTSSEWAETWRSQ